MSKFILDIVGFRIIYFYDNIKKSKKICCFTTFLCPSNFRIRIDYYGYDSKSEIRFFLNDLKYNFFWGPGTGSEPVILRLRINLTYVRP